MKFYKVRILSTLLLLLICCDKEDFFIEKQNYVESVPLNFRHYVQSFISDAVSYGVDSRKIFKVNFKMAVLDSSLSGECSYLKNEIAINSIYWYSSCYSTRKSLIYHELGHCAINQRKHRNDCLGNGFVESIMMSKKNVVDCGALSDDNFFCQEFSEYYLKELFLQNNTPPKWAGHDVYNCTVIFPEIINVYFGNMENFAGGHLEVLKGKELFYSLAFKNLPDFATIKNIIIGDCLEIGDSATVQIRLGKDILVSKNFLYLGRYENINLFETVC